MPNGGLFPPILDWEEAEARDKIKVGVVVAGWSLRSIISFV